MVDNKNFNIKKYHKIKYNYYCVLVIATLCFNKNW